MPEDVAHHAAEEAAAVFDLEQGPPLRARSLRLSEREHVLLITFHHIACDGWSLGILLREWSELYRAFREERAPDLAPIQVQYADFAVWQRERFQGEEVQLQMNYWRERLAGVEPLELPSDHRRPEQSTYRGARMKVQVGRGLKEQLERLSRDHNVTLFITLLSVFQLLLHRYSGQSDIVTGVPVAGRRSMELEGLIGFFVNTLALRTDLSGDATFAELLQRAKETAIGAYSNQDIPFEQVAAELEPLRTVGRSPIFQAMFGYQNAPQGKLEFPDLQWEALDVENTTAKFDLTLNLQPDDGGGLAGALEYSCDLFEPQTAARIANHWMNLLEAAAANPNERISRLEMMSGVERQRILEDWNGSAADMGEARELGAVWEQQAARTPDRIAVEAGDSSISFGHLDRLANGVARQLRALGVETESCVGVCLHRGERLAAAMLGVWKAGSAWVPLDPMQPSQRLAAMIADAGVKAILCDRLTATRLPECTVARVYLDDVEPAANPPFRRVDPDNLAYVIFTSGSTGRPKGVLGTHRAMYNRFAWMWRTHPFEANDVMAQKTASSFVDAIWETFGPLLCGVRLVTIDEDLLIDPPELAPYLSLHQVTRIVLVPSLLRLFMQSDSFSADALPALRHWTSSGEALPPELLRQFREQLPQSAILNLYGSSEVAADSTCWDASTLQPGARVPAGKPIFNTRIYVLDAYGDVVPVGVTGELYIGGAGVARGYAGDLAMTASRFTPDPFSAKPGDRRYRTGDMARWTAGGDLEILGRADSQVKIRGMRIELDEVRACLESHPSVREAVVAVRVARSGEASLVAYVIPLKGASISLESLRRHVRERAPEYMVPGAMVVLERMPLTRSGKVDRQALPEPQAVEEVGLGGYRSQTEEIVGGIWSEVLGREKVGRKENFFELGGHSLLATQVVARVRKALGVEIALRALFEAPTVAGLSRRVEEAGAAVAESALERVSRDVPLPASYGQQRLWFLQQMEPQSAYYNCPGVVRLRGELDEGALERSLREIVRRHEVLRTRYLMQDGELRQIVGTGEEFTLQREELRGPLQERLEAEARRPFDLGEEIPVRALLLRVGEQEWVLSLTLHHIAADGWSMGVLVKELNAHYRGEKLEELGLQYGDYAVWERGRKWEEGLTYWKQRLAGMAPWLELPVDRVQALGEELCGEPGAGGAE